MEAICGLSYTGDIRMRWGEDARKVQRIVEGSWAPLAQMFLPPMQVGQPAAHSSHSPDLPEACHLKTGDTGGELDRKGLLQSQAARLSGTELCRSAACCEAWLGV